ncbi:MAG: gamma-glutamyltransferase family protein [Candidatus Latescibacterota bacterium]|nr:gamma-glutamyltransferase family protein [Candidatus Latescibacterota bacterium]
MFSWDSPYSSSRQPILADNVVATSQPLAAQAGLQMLKDGGNAVDAALAAAITLTVVEPAMNGIGSDAFCILWDGNHLHGLNASGRSPRSWSLDRFRGFSQMPVTGWDSVTVPGCVSAWSELSQRFGSLPFTKLFEAAIQYAEGGYAVGPVTAEAWSVAAKKLGHFKEFSNTFLPQGRAPFAGERFSCKQQARTLQQIAETHGDAFYQGELAEKIVADAQRHGATLSLDDLVNHKCDWVGTVSKDYKEYSIHEIPPNGQGLACLIAFGILRHVSIDDFSVDSTDYLHVQIEAMKLALADAYRYVADADYMDIQCKELLADDYLSLRASQISMDKASLVSHGVPRSSETVYLTTADDRGMMVSFIQSNYMGFGSGIVVPDTGISLQNRGAGFSLVEGHPNLVGGNKRPYHTIIPAFLMREESPVMSYGVMGGPMQAQGHFQITLRVILHGQNPQVAVDAPRWQVMEGMEVAIEDNFSTSILDELENRGHILRRLPKQPLFGGAQLIYRLENGYCAASESRKEGQAVGY